MPVGVRVVGGLAAALIAAGCGAADPPAGVAVAGLPIRDYMFTLAQVHQANEARFVLAGKCMAALGQPFTAPSPREVTEEQAAQLHGRRYGVTDPGSVARLGYHPPVGDVDDSPPVIASMTEAQRSAYQGPPMTSSGGCLGEATRAIAPNGGYAHSALAASIDQGSFQRSRSDRRVVDAVAEWSACMARSGHDYADPLQAVADPRWRAGAGPTADELAVAGRDLACKTDTGLVGTWTAVESELQRQQIDAHRAELDAVRADRDAQLARVAAVLGR